MRRLILASTIFLSLVVGASAQTFRGAINGTVTDPTGAFVPKAQVKAIETATGVEHATSTTAEGEFAFQDIPLGRYKVSIAAPGFAGRTIDNVDVVAGTIYTLPVRLTLGQETTTVEVSAAALVLDTTTQTQTNTIPTESLQAVPLNGRDFSQLIAVSPGYAGYSVGGFGSLNGTRANQMNWQIDGTDNNDFWHNIPAVNQGGVSGIAGVVMPIDAIDEFTAQTESNAETGRSAGGTINLALKSGTNSLRGSVYYYNRNEFYAAHSPFFVATPEFPKAPRLRNENYGITVGGPIIRNKTFWFLGYEKQDYIFGLTGLSTEPSTAWVNTAQAALAKYGVARSPLSTTLLSNLYPSSINNLPAAPSNYFATVPGTGYSYNGVIKLDHNFSEKNHISAHWFGGQGSQTQPPGASLALATASSNLGYYFEVAPIHVQNYSVVFNSLLSPRTSNQVLFGVSYFNQVFHDANNSFNEKNLGLFTSPDALINGQPIFGAPNIAISGFDQVGIIPPEGRNDITGHLTDIVSYIAGAHQFRFGGEVRQGRVDEFYYRRSLGSFNFDGTQGPWAKPAPLNGNNPNGDPAFDATTRALADFLAGDVATSSIAVGHAERQVRANGVDFFAQDAWQVTGKLNLNLGLRWEYFGPPHSLNKDLGVFVAGKGLEIQGAGIDSIFPPSKNNLAPRIGFAYKASEDTVVRGGFGMYYDQINMNPFFDFRPAGTGADGLQDNPIGPSAVDNYSRNVYTWQPNTYIFPGLTTCPTLNGCANTYNVYSVNQNFKTPYFYQYNLQVERSFGNSAVLQVGWVGTEGRRLIVMLDVNQPLANGTLPFAAQFPDAGSILQENSIGYSNYNSLQSTLKLRSWHGFTSQFSYTWGHALDQVTEYRGAIPFDSTNLKQEYGNSDFDTRHSFTAYMTYDIPGSSHGPKLLSQGWQISSLWSFHTGQPFNFAGPGTFATQRPGLNLLSNPFSGVSHNFNPALGMQWVNPNAFCIPGAAGCSGTTNPAGNLTRNKYYGPGFGDVDLSVIKNIPITERVKVQLRAEMFNLFNRINFASGAGSVGSNGYVNDTIGDFNGAPGLGPGEPFNMQLVAKIIF